MINKLVLAVALLLAAATAVSAQDTTPPADAGGDAPAAGSPSPGTAPHFRPGQEACNYSDSSCVWGQLFNSSGPLRAGRGVPMKEGPVDVCHWWDLTCSAPVQTVCELHGRHGWPWGPHWEEEGSFFFVLRTNQSWRVKPRVAGSHSSWEPTHEPVPRGTAPGRIKIVRFNLLGRAASTSICD